MASVMYDNYFADGNGYKAHWSWLNKHINVLGEQSRGLNFQINGYALISDPTGTLRQFYKQAFPSQQSGEIPKQIVEGEVDLKQAWADLDLIKYFRCDEYPEVPQKCDEYVYGMHLTTGPFLIFQNPNREGDNLQYCPDIHKRLFPVDGVKYLEAIKNPGKYMFKNIVGKAHIDFIEQFAMGLADRDIPDGTQIYRDGSTVEITYDLEPSQFYNVFPNVADDKITNKFNFYIDGVVFFGQAYNKLNEDHTAQTNLEDCVPIAIMLYEPDSSTGDVTTDAPRPEMCFGYDYDYVIHEKIALSMNMLDEVQMKFDEIPIQLDKESLSAYTNYVGNFSRVNDGVETIKRFVVQDNAIIQTDMENRNWEYEWRWMQGHNIDVGMTYAEFMDLLDDEKLEVLDTLVHKITSNKYIAYVNNIKTTVKNFSIDWKALYAWCMDPNHFVNMLLAEYQFLSLTDEQKISAIRSGLNNPISNPDLHPPTGSDLEYLNNVLNSYSTKGIDWNEVYEYCVANGVIVEVPNVMSETIFMAMSIDDRISYLEAQAASLPSEDDQRGLMSHMRYVKEDGTTMVTTNRLYYSDENMSNEFNQSFGTPARVTVMTETEPGVKHTQLLIGNEKVVEPVDTTVGYETVWGGVAETYYTQDPTHDKFNSAYVAPSSAMNDDVLAFDFFGEKAPAVNIFSQGTQYVDNPSKGWGANIGAVNSFASTGAVNIKTHEVENGINKSMVIQSSDIHIKANDEYVNAQNGGTFVVNSENVKIDKHNNTSNRIVVFNTTTSTLDADVGTDVAAFNSDHLKTEQDVSRVFAVNAAQMNRYLETKIKGSSSVATFGPAFVQNANHAFVAGAYNQIKGSGYYNNSTILGSYNVIKGDNSIQYDIIEIGKKLTNDHLQQDYDPSLTPTIILGVNNKSYTQCYNRTTKTVVPYTYQKTITTKGVTQILQTAGVSAVKQIKGVKGVKGLSGKTLTSYIKQTADSLQIPLIGTAYQTVIDSQYTPSALKQIIVGGAIPINTNHNIGYNVTKVNGETKYVPWLNKYNMSEFAVNCQVPYDTSMTMYDAVGRAVDYTSRGVNIGLINYRTQRAFDDYDYKSMGSIVWAKLYALLNKLRIDMDYRSYKGIKGIPNYGKPKGLKGIDGINGFGGSYHVLYDTSLSDAGDLLGNITVNKSFATLVNNTYESKDIDTYATSARMTRN